MIKQKTLQIVHQIVLYLKNPFQEHFRISL